MTFVPLALVVPAVTLLPGTPAPAMMPVTAVASAPRVSAPAPVAMTLPKTGFGAVSSVTALTSGFATGLVSRMLMVSVPLALSPPRSLTVSGTGSVVAVTPGWFTAPLSV